MTTDPHGRRRDDWRKLFDESRLASFLLSSDSSCPRNGWQMPRRYSTVLILLAGLILNGAEAYAASKTRQPKMPTEQQFLQGQIHTLRPQRATKDLPVDIEGRTLVHDAKTDTYTITGAARVEQGPTTITADQIVLQHRYQGVAVGHVHMIDPTSDIHSTQAWFDLHNETARLADARILALNDNYYLTGKRRTQTSRAALPGYRCFHYNLYG